MKRKEQTRFVFTMEATGVFLASVSSFLLSSYLLVVTSNYASSLSPSNEQFPILPDLGFNFIPKIEALHLTDVFDNIMICSSMLFMIIQDSRPLYSYSKYFICFSLSYILKGTMVFVTSFPDPRPGCLQIKHNIFSTFVFHRCGDCMFSGHAVVLTLFSIYWFTVKPIRKDSVFYFLRALMWSTALIGFWAIIANRSHYTVDVIVALYISIGVWFTVTHLEGTYIKQRGRLLALTDPDKYHCHKQ